MYGNKVDFDFNSITMYFSGHSFMTDGMGNEKTPAEYTFTYVSKGSKSMVMGGGKEFLLEEGSFIITPPGYRKTSYRGSGIAEDYFVVFLSAEQDVEPKLPIEIGKVYKVKHSPEIEQRMIQLVDESIMSDELHEINFKMLFFETLLYLYRKSINTEFSPHTGSRNTDTDFISHLLCYYASDDYSLDTIAELCKMSKSHLCHKFKAEIGVTPIVYRNLWRLKNSLRYLTKTEMSIASIAEKVGFNSETYFSKTFKKVYGCSPYTYRKENKKSNVTDYYNRFPPPLKK